MAQEHRHTHAAHRMRITYPVSLWQRIHSAFTPIILLVIGALVLRLFSVFPSGTVGTISFGNIGLALAETFGRLTIAYVLSLLVGFPLALLVERSPLAEKIFLPLFDIAQSVPVLAFFPVIVLFFVQAGFGNLAAIFVIFVTMVWSIVFSLVGGLKVIPADIKSVAQVFDVKGASYTRRVLMPATIPYLITGSLLAWAQGWDIIIVAEVLHTYIPGGTPSQDLFGIGSILVNSSLAGQTALFVFAMFFMLGAIAVMNFLIWQKLLHYAERFKFE